MTHSRAQLFDEVYKELSRQKKEESWPDHIGGQLLHLSAAQGELAEAAKNLKYGKSSIGEANKDLENDVRKAAIKNAATCLRFLETLPSNSKTS